MLTEKTFSLDDVRIAAPCRTDWRGMSGDEKVRFCPRCKLNVYNISAMTRKEAEALILSKEGRLCARYYRRFDGTVLTSDCPVGVKALEKIRRGLRLVIAGAAMMLIGKGAASAVRTSVFAFVPFQGSIVLPFMATEKQESKKRKSYPTNGRALNLQRPGVA